VPTNGRSRQLQVSYQIEAPTVHMHDGARGPAPPISNSRSGKAIGSSHSVSLFVRLDHH
jgi:hypothetical protein